MPKVGFEPTIPVFEREKKVHALDRGHCDRPPVTLPEENQVIMMVKQISIKNERIGGSPHTVTVYNVLLLLLINLLTVPHFDQSVMLNIKRRLGSHSVL
jgi:hypothetical protein